MIAHSQYAVIAEIVLRTAHVGRSAQLATDAVVRRCVRCVQRTHFKAFATLTPARSNGSAGSAQPFPSSSRAIGSAFIEIRNVSVLFGWYSVMRRSSSFFSESVRTPLPFASSLT